jgi:THO complex subunit 2
MIAPVVESLKYATPLNLDVVAFVLVDQLTGFNREKLKDDGLNESHWFQSLASFAGQFYRKYPDVELDAILQFVLNQVSYIILPIDCWLIC